MLICYSSRRPEQRQSFSSSQTEHQRRSRFWQMHFTQNEEGSHMALREKQPYNEISEGVTGLPSRSLHPHRQQNLLASHKRRSLAAAAECANPAALQAPAALRLLARRSRARCPAPQSSSSSSRPPRRRATPRSSPISTPASRDADVSRAEDEFACVAFVLGWLDGGIEPLFVSWACARRWEGVFGLFAETVFMGGVQRHWLLDWWVSRLGGTRCGNFTDG